MISCVFIIAMVIIQTQNHVLNIDCITSQIVVINNSDAEDVQQVTHTLNITDYHLNLKKWNYVYFQHLRKTGGTSVVDVVYHNNNLCISNRCIIWSVYGGLAKNIDDHKQKADEMKLKLIVNEWYPFYVNNYLIHKYDKWNDVLLTTILRDPIKRVYSDIATGATWHCGGNITMEQFIDKLKSGDEQFLIQCAIDHQYTYTSNLYIKVFSGSWKYAINFPEYHLKKHDIDYNPNHTVDRMHLEIAKSIIKDFDVILILEQYDETSVQLKCNGINDTIWKNDNMGHYKHRLDEFPKLKKLLYELNQLDIEFYEFATKLALQKADTCNKYREFVAVNL